MTESVLDSLEERRSKWQREKGKGLCGDDMETGGGARRMRRWMRRDGATVGTNGWD